MKTKLFLIATLLITAVTFSQTSKKGYDAYTSNKGISKSKKMNKAELIDAMAKVALLNKSLARTGRNPQTGKEIKSLPTGRSTYAKNSLINQNGDDYFVRKRPGRVKYSNITLEKGHLDEDSDNDGILDGDDLRLRKKPGRSQGDPVPGIGITKEQGYSKNLRKKPGRTSKNVGVRIPGGAEILNKSNKFKKIQN